jgi:adenine specific DNA methylase Mod
MLKEVLENNAKVRPDIDFLNELQQHFPQFFDKDGNFNNEKFSAELRENNIAEARDGYRLSFVGKDYGRLQTGRASETMITPDIAHNSKPENGNSQNIFITGDNLEALRHLQNAYNGRVKMIYIDPPYNTGKEFVYSDSFEFDDQKLKTALGYNDEEIERLKSIQGTNKHSAWLTFMYPRLKLAQRLLADDGVIFISIDDNEQANLKLLMDDVFGEGNFEATIIPIVNPGGRDYKQVAITNEYIMIYSKSNVSEITEIPKEAEFTFSDSKGGFNFRELRNRNPKFHSGNRPNLFYPFYVNPKNKTKDGYCAISLEKNDEFSIKIRPYNSEGKESVWRWGKVRANENIIKNDLDKSQILAKQKNDGNWNIYEKSRITTTKVKSVWDETEMRTENGTREIRALFGETVFDHPKPISLIKRCLQIGTYEDSLILDFFAGSATTAHAVMQLNAEDGGNRKFIMVQLDEEINPDSEARKAGFKTVDEISRERIKRAAMKIKSENPMFADERDLGFKHYRLTTPTVKTLDKIIEFNPEKKNIFGMDMISETGGLDTILTTWLIDEGNTFDARVEEVILSNYTAQYIAESKTLYLINEEFNTEALKAMLNKTGTGELPVSSLVVYPYSFGFEIMRELEIGVKSLNNVPKIIKNY